MRINGSRAVLTRALMRKSIRSRSAKAISARTSASSSKNNSSTSKTSTTKSDGTSNSYTSKQSQQLALYEDMEAAAKSLQENAKKLLNKGKNTVKEESTETTEKATTEENETAEKTELVKIIKNLVNNYNTIYEKMQEAGGSTNIAQCRGMKNIAIRNKTDLEEAGISITNKGVLSVDTKSLEAVDMDTLKHVFCEESSFTASVSERAESIEKNAKTTASTLTRAYAIQNYSKYGTSSYVSDYSYLGNRYSSSV